MLYGIECADYTAKCHVYGGGEERCGGEDEHELYQVGAAMMNIPMGLGPSPVPNRLS